MIARGSLGNPWIFEELTGERTEPPTDEETVAELLWVMDRAAEHLGPERGGALPAQVLPVVPRAPRCAARGRGSGCSRPTGSMRPRPWSRGWRRPTLRPVTGLTDRVERWRARGADEEVRGRRIHVFRREGEGPAAAPAARLPVELLRLAAAARRDPGRARCWPSTASASASPRSPPTTTTRWSSRPTSPSSWSTAHHPGEEVFLVGHDMGTSVATELMARDIDGDCRHRHRRRDALQRLDDPGRGAARRWASGCCAGPLGP